MSTITKNGTTFTRHRPKDPLDPGFAIVGWKLYWVHSRQSEDKAGRIWKIVRKELLPAQLVKDLEDGATDYFQGGSTIRRGDLTLAFAPIGTAQTVRKDLDKQARDQFERIQHGPSANSSSISLNKRETAIEGRAGAENFEN